MHTYYGHYSWIWICFATFVWYFRQEIHSCTWVLFGCTDERGCYQKTDSCTVTRRLIHVRGLGWKRLEDRRKDLRLALLYKIVHGHVAVPVDALNLEPPDPRTRKKHKYTYKHLTPHTDPYKHFFLCRTIPEWNSLPASAVEATSVESFKTHLAGRPQRDQPWSGTSTHPRHTPEEDCGLRYQTITDSVFT